MDNLHCAKETILCYQLIHPLAVSTEDEWNTKEDTVKFTKNALYALWYAKRNFWRMMDSEKIKPVALSEGISQLGSQLVEN